PDVQNRGLEPGVYWAHRFQVAYDSRDDMDIPGRGMYAATYTEAADRALGSSTSFVKFGGLWLDFVPLCVRNVHGVLALRGLLDYVSGSGDTPFWELSSLGGRRTLRAFGNDRFMDFNRSLRQHGSAGPGLWTPPLRRMGRGRARALPRHGRGL